LDTAITKALRTSQNRLSSFFCCAFEVLLQSIKRSSISNHYISAKYYQVLDTQTGVQNPPPKIEKRLPPKAKV
jgi:hypothetical protein